MRLNSYCRCLQVKHEIQKSSFVTFPTTVLKLLHLSRSNCTLTYKIYVYLTHNMSNGVKVLFALPIAILLYFYWILQNNFVWHKTQNSQDCFLIEVSVVFKDTFLNNSSFNMKYYAKYIITLLKQASTKLLPD